MVLKQAASAILALSANEIDRDFTMGYFGGSVSLLKKVMSEYKIEDDDRLFITGNAILPSDRSQQDAAREVLDYLILHPNIYLVIGQAEKLFLDFYQAYSKKAEEGGSENEIALKEAREQCIKNHAQWILDLDEKDLKRYGDYLANCAQIIAVNSNDEDDELGGALDEKAEYTLPPESRHSLSFLVAAASVPLSDQALDQALQKDHFELSAEQVQYLTKASNHAYSTQGLPLDESIRTIDSTTAFVGNDKKGEIRRNMNELNISVDFADTRAVCVVDILDRNASLVFEDENAARLSWLEPSEFANELSYYLRVTKEDVPLGIEFHQTMILVTLNGFHPNNLQEAEHLREKLYQNFQTLLLDFGLDLADKESALNDYLNLVRNITNFILQISSLSDSGHRFGPLMPNVEANILRFYQGSISELAFYQSIFHALEMETILDPSLQNVLNPLLKNPEFEAMAKLASSNPVNQVATLIDDSTDPDSIDDGEVSMAPTPPPEMPDIAVIKLKETGNIYAIGDVHGTYSLLMKVIHEMKIGNEDTLFIMGDSIDRGERKVEDRGGHPVVLDQDVGSPMVLDYLMAHPNVICIRGNHEDLFLRCAKMRAEINAGQASPETLNHYPGIYENYMDNGGAWINAFTDEELKKYVDFVETFPRLGIVVNTLNEIQCLFAHASVPIPDQEVDERLENHDFILEDYQKTYIAWARQNTRNPNDPKIDPNAQMRTAQSYTAFVGHTVAEGLRKQMNEVNLDFGAFYTGTFCVVDLKAGRTKLVFRDDTSREKYWEEYTNLKNPISYHLSVSKEASPTPKVQSIMKEVVSDLNESEMKAIPFWPRLQDAFYEKIEDIFLNPFIDSDKREAALMEFYEKMIVFISLLQEINNLKIRQFPMGKVLDAVEEALPFYEKNEIDFLEFFIRFCVAVNDLIKADEKLAPNHGLFAHPEITREIKDFLLELLEKEDVKALGIAYRTRMGIDSTDSPK